MNIALVLLGLAVVGVAGGMVTGNLSIGDQGGEQTGEQVAWGDYKESVGLKFPAQTASESVVLIPEGTNAENYGSPDVTSVGADSDEQDTTELFASADKESGEDYYKYTTFNSQITNNLPEAGKYKVAVIGSGVVNEYTTYTIPGKVDKLKVENSLPLQPLSESATAYAADADITNSDTRVEDGGSTIALDTDYSDDVSDSNVDGSITGVQEYDVASGVAATFGEMSVSSVNGNVSEIQMTAYVDGEQVKQATDSDFSDSNGLDDGVEFGPVRAEDSFMVECKIKFDDASTTTAVNLATCGLDDTDDDSTSSDGSYGISELSTTWTGY